MMYCWFFIFFWTATFWHSHWTVLTLPMSTFIHNSSMCQNMWYFFTTRDDGAIKHHSKTHQSGGGGGRLVVFRLNRSRLSGRIDEMCNLPHQIFMPLGLNFTRYSLECSVAFGNADHLDTSSSPPYLSSPSLPPSHVISSSRQASVWARYACMNSTSCPALWSLEMKCLSCRHLCQNYGPETTLTHLQPIWHCHDHRACFSPRDRSRVFMLITPCSNI